MVASQTLKQRLAEARVLLAPGVYDALSALIAEQSGFEALYLSGASIAYTRLGRSDVGLTTYNEVEDVLARITDRVRLPVIVDADTGFGNALNVQRTVRVADAVGRIRPEGPGDLLARLPRQRHRPVAVAKQCLHRFGRARAARCWATVAETAPPRHRGLPAPGPSRRRRRARARATGRGGAASTRGSGRACRSRRCRRRARP